MRVPFTIASHGPARSLEAYLDELVSALAALPLTSPERGKLAQRIREVEIEIDARTPL